MNFLAELGVVLLALGIVLRPLLRSFLVWVARARSNELFLLAAFLLALGTAYGAHLAGLSPAIGAFLGGMVVGESDFRHEVEDDLRPFRDLLLGCGRVGRLVALVLGAAGLPYLAIERDIDRVRGAHRQGLRMLYGDARRRRLLEAAGLMRARLVLLTFDTPSVAPRILHQVRSRRPDLPVLVSATDADRLEDLTRAGAHAVFVEAHAAGLALADEALVFAGFDRRHADEVVAQVRAELNPELAGYLNLPARPPTVA